MELLNYCKVAGGNFGDDLNLRLWDALFSNFAALKGEVLFYGIGTLLGARHDPTQRKVVLGSGAFGPTATPDNSRWDFRWVRGPNTAKLFGLSDSLALGDPAILWPELHPGHDIGGPVGLIPHCATWDSFDWSNIAVNAGMIAINPKRSPNSVITQMRSCSRILAESLHGAIFADAMEIPWAACILAHRFNEFKWRDWLGTINRPYAPLATDRPLVRSLSRTKAIANKLARALRYQYHTRHPQLRPVAVATVQDVQCVTELLHQFGNDSTHFRYSAPSVVAEQRKQMTLRCEEFATDYRLEFTPQW